MKTCLCPAPSYWPGEDTDRLVEWFEQSLEAGQNYLQGGQWSTAVSYLGAAYQLAQSMLEDQRFNPVKTLYDFSTACVLLILAYKKLARINEAFDVFATALQSIENLERAPPDLRAECLERVGFECPDPQPGLGNPSGRIKAH